MIYNRTLADVQEAKRIREEKAKNLLPLTDEEKETIERGFYTVNTVNRIEQQEMILTNLLHSMGYYNIGLASDNNFEWTINKFFKKIDHERLVNKCKVLREGFLSAPYYSDLPSNRVDYIQLNNLEKALADIYTNAIEVKELYTECGTVDCGGD